MIKLISSWETRQTSNNSFFSFCAVFSVLHKQILTAQSRGGSQTQDICFSASQRHGRDFDTGCQGNLTRQASCFIGAFKKCAAVALACVFRTSFCLFPDCYALRRWHWNGMSCKTNERGERRKEKERERERNRSQAHDLFGRAMCLELAGDAIESDTPGWSCQTATSCPLYSHIAGV